jgi:hypothetical protein
MGIPVRACFESRAFYKKDARESKKFGDRELASGFVFNGLSERAAG